MFEPESVICMWYHMSFTMTPSGKLTDRIKLQVLKPTKTTGGLASAQLFGVADYDGVSLIDAHSK